MWRCPWHRKRCADHGVRGLRLRRGDDAAGHALGTVGLRTAFYSANVQKDRHGKSVDNNLSLDILSLGVAYMHMTDHTVLGAKYGFGAVVPFFQMDASVRCRPLSGRWTWTPICSAWPIYRCCR